MAKLRGLADAVEDEREPVLLPGGQRKAITQPSGHTTHETVFPLGQRLTLGEQEVGTRHKNSRMRVRRKNDAVETAEGLLLTAADGATFAVYVNAGGGLRIELSLRSGDLILL